MASTPTFSRPRRRKPGSTCKPICEKTRPVSLKGALPVKTELPSHSIRGLPLIEMEADTLISPELLQLDELMLALPNGGKITGNVLWRHQRGTASGDLRAIRLDPAGIDSRLRTARSTGQ